MYQSYSVQTPAVAAIDFGTTCTGYAYHLRKGRSYHITDIHIDQAWTGSSEVGLQAPTTVLMKPDQTFHSFGFEAETKYKSLSIQNQHRDWYYFQFFKMKLHHERVLSRDMLLDDANGKPMRAMVIFTEAIKYVKDHLLQKIQDAVKDRVHVQDITWVLTVPAIWTDSAKQFMREAAVQAGIPVDFLLLALEPEAAAIYCKELAVRRTQGVDGAFLRAFDPGEKYVVLDLGGGTVDTTVHEVLEDGLLRELHAATGGAWGGVLVNEAFEEFIQTLVGDAVFKKFCHDFPSDWIELQKNFETKKRQFSPKTEDIDLNFPASLSALFAKSTCMQLCDILDEPEYRDNVQLFDHYMILKPERMKMFFGEAVDKINKHIQQLLGKKNLSKVSTILLVGGFSESPIVSEGVRNCFKDKRVIAPATAGVAILKGAVMYGIDTNIIASRISPFSYGVHTRAVYNSKIHPADKKKQIGDKFIVDNAFDKHIEAGETIQVGGSAKLRKYIVHNTRNKEVFWKVYKSVLKEPGICDDKFCSKIGRLTITIPDSVKSEKVRLEVKMICRGTELDAIAKTVKPLVECKAKFDFLGMEDLMGGEMDMVAETAE